MSGRHAAHDEISTGAALLIRGMPYGTAGYNTPENASLAQLNEMLEPIFADIRGTPEFIAITEKLKVYAAKRE